MKYMAPAWVDTRPTYTRRKKFPCAVCSAPLEKRFTDNVMMWSDEPVYHYQHCPDPPKWEWNHDGMGWCQRCGVERGDYWEWKATGVMPS